MLGLPELERQRWTRFDEHRRRQRGGDLIEGQDPPAELPREAFSNVARRPSIHSLEVQANTQPPIRADDSGRVAKLTEVAKHSAGIPSIVDGYFEDRLSKRGGDQAKQ
ncbi:MAG: hypothetical protein KC912_22520 [Proteobacteria bacterium]|nr:hypothetical protein [Pseudomonadota bacterium]